MFLLEAFPENRKRSAETAGEALVPAMALRMPKEWTRPPVFQLGPVPYATQKHGKAMKGGCVGSRNPQKKGR
jgi:hypothetical protein